MREGTDAGGSDRGLVVARNLEPTALPLKWIGWDIHLPWRYRSQQGIPIYTLSVNV